MKIKFDRFEHSVSVNQDHASILEVQDREVFSRVVQSLQEEKYDQAIEPFSIWNDDGSERKRKGSELLVIDSLPNFPLNDRKLVVPLIKKVSKNINSDLEKSSQINALMIQIEDAIGSVRTNIIGSYDFELDYGIEAFMKALSFGTSVRSDDSLFEKGIAFLNLCSDIELKKVLVFVNAKSFFSPDYLQKLINHAIFLKIPTLFLESWHDDMEYKSTQKLCIDQYFLEY